MKYGRLSENIEDRRGEYQRVGVKAPNSRSTTPRDRTNRRVDEAHKQFTVKPIPVGR